jgi:hypothetical protein
MLQPDPVTALTPTSQAGGHVPRSNEYAMTAPGSVPAADHDTFVTEPVPYNPPVVDVTGDKIPPSDDGKPQAKGQDWSPQGPAAWGPVAPPKVIREK